MLHRYEVIFILVRQINPDYRKFYNYPSKGVLREQLEERNQIKTDNRLLTVSAVNFIFIMHNLSYLKIKGK